MAKRGLIISTGTPGSGGMTTACTAVTCTQVVLNANVALANVFDIVVFLYAIVPDYTLFSVLHQGVS
jgi:Tfp pilus assembly ATPase PilU